MAFKISGTGNSISKSFNDSIKNLEKSYQKLSSGKRINTASDDAAGLAIASDLASSVQISSQGRRNLGDATSAISIADNAFGSLSDIGNRLTELATESANGTLSDSQRTSLNNEFSQLTQEAQRITSTTQFNGKSLLNASDGISVQAGTDGSANSQINVGSTDVSSLVANLSSLSVSTADSAKNAIDQLANLGSQLSNSRSTLGASESRIQSSISNSQSYEVNATEAKSRIEDLDYAQALAEKTANSIRVDVNGALSAQSGKLNRDIVAKLLG